ncbi:MAG: hypothetical protein IID49_04360 [Proteobacteria bacterium]|nr:hypothetical protein [Pseudomonadota bacterium]
MITQTANRSHHRRRGRPIRIAIGAAILAVAGCAEIEVGAQAYKTFARASEPAPGPPAAPDPARHDSIDASLRPDPEAFHAAGLALWDGRQTLAGIWVAHPLARTARRVRVTNAETGTRIDAAMFRRDPGLPGPPIIVSSEAARRLGLTPGQATPVTIEGLAGTSRAAVETVAQPGPAEAAPARG